MWLEGDFEQKDIYSLIVMVVGNLIDKNLEQMANDLKQEGFDIYLDENRTVEAYISHNNYFYWEMY